jgi:mono/diheme cytochrome c family protein
VRKLPLHTGRNAAKDFGPDLSNIGAKNISQLEFGDSKIPRNIISYIKAKITNPLSVNSAARMPQYRVKPEDVDAITTALLGMTGTPKNSGFQRLIVPRQQATFQPGGAFGEVFKRYKCDVCHQFNGFGGTLAPDLSFEGSRAQRQWIIDFLKNPKTLRPTLTFRMPQFNMSDQDAATAADYLALACDSPSVDAAAGRKQFTPEMAALGKQLYEVKYTCQACHTIGSTGGYVGPNLSNAGNWLTAPWIEEWLKNPQALVPGAIEPRRSFTDEERDALTAYILTLKQSGPAKPAGAMGGGQ